VSVADEKYIPHACKSPRPSQDQDLSLAADLFAVCLEFFVQHMMQELEVSHRIADVITRNSR
jgi:hypothetical protein